MTISKNIAKYIIALQNKKYRHQYKRFLVEGDKLVRELLFNTTLKVELLAGMESWMASQASFLNQRVEKVFPVDSRSLKKISALSTPNQVLAVVEMPEVNSPKKEIPGWRLYLDGLRDPGNVGALLRVAEWFGLREVIASFDTVDWYHPKVVQASMGSILRLPVHTMSLQEYANEQPPLPVIGADMEGIPLKDVAFPESGILVIGNESQGIREETATFLSSRVTIPQRLGGKAESLNAAVAAGILCAHLPVLP